MIGGFVISYQQIFQSIDLKTLKYTFSSKDSLVGVGYSLIAVLGWGSATVFGKKLSKQGFSAPEVMSGRFIFGLSACLLFLPSVSIEKIGGDFLTKMVVLVFFKWSVWNIFLLSRAGKNSCKNGHAGGIIFSILCGNYKLAFFTYNIRLGSNSWRCDAGFRVHSYSA